MFYRSREVAAEFCIGLVRLFEMFEAKRSDSTATKGRESEAVWFDCDEGSEMRLDLT